MYQALFPPQKLTPFCLYFDNVDDYVSMPDSTFYDFGLGDFTLWIRVFLTTSNGRSGNSSGQDLIGKRESAEKKYVVSIAENKVLFVVDNRNGSGLDSDILILSTDNSVPLGQFVDVIARRNGGVSGNNSIDAYQIFFNGILQDSHAASSTTTSTNWNATFAAAFTFQNSTVTDAYVRTHMFVSGAGCWNVALTDTQIAGITSARVVPPDGGRGYWPFSHTSGKSVADFSSVQKTGVLYNYSDAETGLPDSKTNRVWFAEEAIFFLSNAQPTATRTIRAAHSATGFRTFGTFVNSVSWLLLDAGGNIKTTGTLPAGAGSYTPTILPIAAGDTLSFTSTGIDAAANCAVGVLWAA